MGNLSSKKPAARQRCRSEAAEHSDSDSEYFSADESMPVASWADVDIACIMERLAYHQSGNALGAYQRANNGKSPLRDAYEKPIAIKQIELTGIGNDSGRVYPASEVKPFISSKTTASQRLVQLEGAMQYRIFTEADMQHAGERTLIGQGMVVANRRLQAGDFLGVYGGRIVPVFMMRLDDPFYLNIGSSKQRFPTALSGDNILSRVNTIFEYDDAGRPFRQASVGYNIEPAHFDVIVQHEGQTATRALAVAAFFALEDIPAGRELRWNYGYSEEKIAELFGGDIEARG